MKKFLKPLLYSCIAIGGSIHLAQAQDAANNTAKNDGTALLALTNNSAAVTGMSLASVNFKLDRIFSKSYKNAQNVKWYNNGNGYLAEFEWNGVKTHALYGKGGYWYYDVRFGNESDLSRADTRLIKSNYVNYNIGKATEVNLGGDKHAWVVNLQDADNLVLARIMNGQLDELAHYTTHAPAKTKKARIVIPQ